ncbi:ATP cone domain-containing protein [Lutispora thermophila]|uniref:ATP cone domain-containing protein n=1 Tax=Lutispora thermophila DSM 19022 TaxID=1122184 RepID=A0A1M6BSG9_9FIRM|nr:ATP cone domain-containing protein [Lutispora thermophila]SHI51553.1 ATP cone domain-containing protein [Lutispora thermophila DSM 19022]
MLVMKKNGTFQEFDIEKVKKSIDNCRCKVDCYMNQGDIQALASQFHKVFLQVTKDNNHTSSYEIRGIVYHVLMENGFRNVAKSYMDLC